MANAKRRRDRDRGRFRRQRGRYESFFRGVLRRSGSRSVRATRAEMLWRSASISSILRRCSADFLSRAVTSDRVRCDTGEETTRHVLSWESETTGNALWMNS